MRSPGRGWCFAEGKRVTKRYLGGEVSPLGSALIVQGDSSDPSKDDILRDLHTQAAEP